eukprot:2063610-Amphidinium_carterae.1
MLPTPSTPTTPPDCEVEDAGSNLGDSPNFGGRGEAAKQNMIEATATGGTEADAPISAVPGQLPQEEAVSPQEPGASQGAQPPPPSEAVPKLKVTPRSAVHRRDSSDSPGAAGALLVSPTTKQRHRRSVALISKTSMQSRLFVLIKVA